MDNRGLEPPQRCDEIPHGARLRPHRQRTAEQSPWHKRDPRRSKDAGVGVGRGDHGHTVARGLNLLNQFHAK